MTTLDDKKLITCPKCRKLIVFANGNCDCGWASSTPDPPDAERVSDVEIKARIWEMENKIATCDGLTEHDIAVFYLREQLCAYQELQHLRAQIDKLANFIMAEVDGEPSKNEGAVECAIRLLRAQQAKPALNISEAMMAIDTIKVPVRYDSEKEKWEDEPLSTCSDAIEKIRTILGDWFVDSWKQKPALDIDAVMEKIGELETAYALPRPLKEEKTFNKIRAILETAWKCYLLGHSPISVNVMTMTADCKRCGALLNVCYEIATGETIVEGEKK